MADDKTIPELNSVSQRGGANGSTSMAAAHSYNGQLEDVQVSLNEIAEYVEGRVNGVIRKNTLIELYTIPRSLRYPRMRVIVESVEKEYVLILNPLTETTNDTHWEEDEISNTSEMGTWQEAEDYFQNNLNTLI